jgi:hypothetical protein
MSISGSATASSPPVFTTATAIVAPLQAQHSTSPTDALAALTAAVYGLQHQMANLQHQFANLDRQLRRVENRSPLPAICPPLLPVGSPAPTTAPAIYPPQLPSVSLPAPAPGPFPQPISWLPPQPAGGLPVVENRSTPASTATVAATPTTGAVFFPGGPSLQHPFTDGIFYRGTDVQQIRMSAAVRLQAAARGFLARRRVREMRDLQLIQPCSPSLPLQVVFRRLEDFDLVSCAADLQHTVFPTGGVQVVYPVGSDPEVCGSGARGGAPFLATSRKALPSATTFRHRPPRGRLRWSLSRLIPGGYARAPLSFRWSPWDPGGYRAGSSCGGCPTYLQESKIKSRGRFQVNKISRDVKGLFLGVRFVFRRVIVRLQLEDELHVQVGCSVRGVKGLLGLSPLGLISPLLKGQVKPLYIMRGDVSI